MNSKENKINNDINLNKTDKMNSEENKINNNNILNKMDNEENKDNNHTILNKMDNEENKINDNIICRKRENNEEINIENIKKSKYFEFNKIIKEQSIIENLKDTNCKDKLDITLEGKEINVYNREINKVLLEKKKEIILNENYEINNNQLNNSLSIKNKITTKGVQCDNGSELETTIPSEKIKNLNENNVLGYNNGKKTIIKDLDVIDNNNNYSNEKISLSQSIDDMNNNNENIADSNNSEEIIEQMEVTYQLPKYEFIKEKTLRSINSIYNPRCSTTNNLNNESTFNNYFKSAKWSPDGTCILSSSNDNNLRLFELPDITKNKEKGLKIDPVLKVCDGESVYDYCWYPYMRSSDPSSSVFISASRDLPIHMWDAYYGTIRASYCTYDIYDQIVAPHSINFNLDGSKIYAGLNNLIQIFDISRPGEPIDKKLTTPTRKSKHGQKGIIACMDFNTDYSGLLAAGSLSKSIGIYDTNNSNELIFQKKKLKGGVIQVQFSSDGNYLYSVSRQTDGIICWDIRNTGNMLCDYTRPGKTNQRISFDISKDGRYLISGDKEGYLNVYELKNFVKSAETLEELNNQKMKFESIEPLYRYKVQKDTITSTAFHPYYPILFTCSGQRKFKLNIEDFENENKITNSENIINNTVEKPNENEMIENDISENVLSIWQVGPI